MLNLEKIEQLAEIVAMNLITVDRNTEKIISDVVVTDNSDQKYVALKNKIDKLAAAIQSTENARVRQLVELQKMRSARAATARSSACLSGVEKSREKCRESVSAEHCISCARSCIVVRASAFSWRNAKSGR